MIKMMAIDIIQIFAGMAFALFIPGFLIVMIFFSELSKLEKLAFSVGFSIMADITIAIFLGYDHAQAIKTGGLNLMNIVYAEIIIVSALGLLLALKILLKKKANLFIKHKPTNEKNIRKNDQEEDTRKRKKD